MAKKTKNSADASEKGFPEKWSKVLKQIPEFVGVAEAASNDELKKIIFQCESNVYTLEQEKETNVDLLAAKENLKTLNEPFAEALKVQKAKINYAMYLLESKGENLDNREDED